MESESKDDLIQTLTDVFTEAIPDTYWEWYKSLPLSAQLFLILVPAHLPILTLIPFWAVFAPANLTPLFVIQLLIDLQTLVGITNPSILAISYLPFLIVLSILCHGLILAQVGQIPIED